MTSYKKILTILWKIIFNKIPEWNYNRLRRKLSDNRPYEDLMKLVTVLKRIQYTDKFLQRQKYLQTDDDFGLEDSIRVSIRKRKYLLDQMFDEYQRPSYS